MSSRVDTYEQAIEYLYSRINYERLNGDAYSAGDFKLDRMRELLERLEHPERYAPVIHVAGTKGKGSTCAMLASILQASGRRTGLYTSPHITCFEERMVVDGTPPTAAQLVELVRRVQPVVEWLDALPGRRGPTYFELATAIAWLFFQQERCDAVVLETGLGGRLDSTNVCSPVLTIITNVSRDHMQLLGDTVRLIAAEKAGILKPGVPNICGAQHPDAVAVVAEVAARLAISNWVRNVDYRVKDFSAGEARIEVGRECYAVPVPLLGAHQADNSATVVAAIVNLRARGWDIGAEALSAGLAKTRWPGRIEKLRDRPTVILDAAHNWESIKALIATLPTVCQPRKRVLIFAATSDKDVAGLLRHLLPAFDTVIFTRYVDNPRGVPQHTLCDLALRLAARPCHMAHTPLAAWELAQQLSGPDDLIVATGSFFLVAELRTQILSAPQPSE